MNIIIIIIIINANIILVEYFNQLIYIYISMVYICQYCGCYWYVTTYTNYHVGATCYYWI